MNEFGFMVTQEPDGFTVSATADRTPVTVTLQQWRWHVAVAPVANIRSSASDVGLIRTRLLVDTIAADMCRSQFTDSRSANVRVKYGTVPRTARSIHHRVLADVKRLLDGVPDEVIATQRAVFAAAYATGGADAPELYRPEYALLRRDIRQYRAAALALVKGHELVKQAARREVENSPEFTAVKAAAERAGLTVSVGQGAWTGSADASRDKAVVLDRLAADWRGVFSPDGKPYRSLNRTLMNLPGGVPADMLRFLADMVLPRPVTDRVELLALCAFYKHACGREQARQHYPVFLRARRPDILRAIETAANATRTPMSARRTADIVRAVGFICDYPEEHRGNVVGLARKSARWHRDVAQREAAEVVERLGDRPAAMPPVPPPGVPGVTFLASVARIAEEGMTMDHCAASYASDAVAGRCYLFHLEHDGEHATAEVAPDGRVVQVQGPRNQANAAVRWGTRVLARWARGFPQCAPPALPAGADPWAPADNEQPF